MFLFSSAYPSCGKSPSLVLHSCFLPVCTLLSLQDSTLLKPNSPRRNTNMNNMKCSTVLPSLCLPSRNRERAICLMLSALLGLRMLQTWTRDQ